MLLRASVAALALAMTTPALARPDAPSPDAPSPDAPSPDAPSAHASAANPLLGAWQAPFGAPPYDRIEPAHYLPAFEAAMAETRTALDAIATNRARPTFANTIEAMERAGAPLDRVAKVFFTVTGADGTADIQAVESAIQPRLARFRSDTFLDQRLWNRVRTLNEERARLRLTPEQARLLEITHRSFMRAGAALDGAQRQRIAAIDERLSALGVEFAQRLVADQKASDLFLTDADMAGIPADAKAAAAAAARAAGRDGFLIASTRSDVEPFLTLATNRAAREKVWRAFVMRGDNGNANDTNALIRETLQLRLERARLLGYASHADFALETSMAKTPAAALELSRTVYDAGMARARAEEADLLKLAARDGLNRIEPWDWRYYAEQVRSERFAFDEAQLKQYLPLEQVVAALWETNQRLFGLTATERPDIPGYADGVRVFEIREGDGRHVGLFYADWFTRPTKRPGAWMNEIRTQNGLTGATPIVVNNCNYVVPAEGQPALISLDDAETLFHEFGHALHGLLSNTRYPSLAGTAVYRDFVEFPSQVYEHWMTEPEILSRHARNAAGEPMPEDLLERVLAARTFNQGFLTVQQLSSALVDMEIHQLTEIPDDFDPRGFEAAALARLGVPESIGMRHRLAHFTHLFQGGGYAAGYYAYTWSEVLEADAFDAWQEAGGPWDTEVADRYRREILAVGNSRDPQASYVAFRGRMPTAAALLRNRGLITEQ